jgi:beta-N-acetylhexosaminidase
MPATARAVLNATRLGARLIAAELVRIGINVDCVPVADLRHPEGHGIIGDRAYGSEPAAVAELAGAAAEGLIDGGVLPIVKHIPGHGRARADSHEELPVVQPARRTRPHRLRAVPPACRTARGHDRPCGLFGNRPGPPATVSPVMIGEIIRKRIGFDGLLLTDDLSMKALEGSLGAAPRRPLPRAATSPSTATAGSTRCGRWWPPRPKLAGEAARRADAALGRLGTPGKDLNVAEARALFSAMIAA